MVYCFPVYGLAATTSGLAPEESQGKERLSNSHEHRRVSAATVERPCPASNGKPLFSREFFLAPAAGEPQPQRPVRRRQPAGRQRWHEGERGGRQGRQRHAGVAPAADRG